MMITMFGRLFGRHEDEDEKLSCAECGRTLLAGEWTQRSVDDDGEERYICALCSRPQSSAGGDTDPALEAAPVGASRVKSTRSESDAFWRAMKDKDAEIERLESRLARAEAEKQELTAELSRQDALSGAVPGVAPAPSGAPADATPLAPEPSPHEARSVAPLVVEPPVVETIAVEPPAVEPPPFVQTSLYAGEIDDEEQTLAPGSPATGAPAEPPASGAPTADAGRSDTPSAGDRGTDSEEVTLAPGARVSENAVADVAPPAFVAPSPVVEPASAAQAPAGPAAAEPEGIDEASLTILQRGVDLLNVSAVPRRIVETIESLGIPGVHVGSADGGTLLVTFMWSMGWYQFRVELADGGRVTLEERGYDQRADLQSNASVRPDGTVQLAPIFAKPPTPREPQKTGPPSTTSGVIISKSLMGQRTDDENVPQPWENTQARDFDWGR
jgi:hypothetical protein